MIQYTIFMLQSDRARAAINGAGQSDQIEGSGISELVNFAATIYGDNHYIRYGFSDTGRAGFDPLV